MTMTYMPYTGNPLTYGYGPEHTFFGTLAGLPASQDPAPIVVPSYPVVVAAGGDNTEENLTNNLQAQGGGADNLAGGMGGGGGGGGGTGSGGYSPSFDALGLFNSSGSSTPANFNSNIGSIAGGLGTLAGMATGVPGIGTVLGAAGNTIDLALYADILEQAGIPFDPNYLEAAAVGALPGIPFTEWGVGSLLGLDSPRQQFEDARRTALGDSGRLGDNVTLGDAPLPSGWQDMFAADMGRQPTLSEVQEAATEYRSNYLEAPVQGVWNNPPATPFSITAPDEGSFTVHMTSDVAQPSQAPAPSPVQAAAPSYTHDAITGGLLGMDPGAEHAAGMTNVGGTPAFASPNQGGGESNPAGSYGGGGGGGGESNPSGGGDFGTGDPSGGGMGGQYGGYDAYGGGNFGASGGGYGPGKKGGKVTKKGVTRKYVGGGPIQGPGDGMSDSVPGLVDGVEPVRLATDEHVLPADVISLIGSGSSNVGHKKVARWISQIRQRQMGRNKQIAPFRSKGLAQLVG